MITVNNCCQSLAVLITDLQQCSLCMSTVAKSLMADGCCLDTKLEQLCMMKRFTACVALVCLHAVFLRQTAHTGSTSSHPQNAQKKSPELKHAVQNYSLHLTKTTNATVLGLGLRTPIPRCFSGSFRATATSTPRCTTRRSRK